MELAQDWAAVTQIDAGRVPNSEFAVMLRFALSVTPGARLLQPEDSTPALYLTERQARDLILLLGHSLGLPGTGIESTPPAQGH